jgi:hypothetical protein
VQGINTTEGDEYYEGMDFAAVQGIKSTLGLKWVQHIKNSHDFQFLPTAMYKPNPNNPAPRKSKRTGAYVYLNTGTACKQRTLEVMPCIHEKKLYMIFEQHTLALPVICKANQADVCVEPPLV